MQRHLWMTYADLIRIALLGQRGYTLANPTPTRLCHELGLPPTICHRRRLADAMRRLNRVAFLRLPGQLKGRYGSMMLCEELDDEQAEELRNRRDALLRLIKDGPEAAPPSNPVPSISSLRRSTGASPRLDLLMPATPHSSAA